MTEENAIKIVDLIVQEAVSLEKSGKVSFFFFFFLTFK